jgi:hypothetical protein
MSTEKINEMCMSLVMSVLSVEIAIIEANQSLDLIKELEDTLKKVLPSDKTISDVEKYLEIHCGSLLPADIQVWCLKPMISVRDTECASDEKEERKKKGRKGEKSKKTGMLYQIVYSLSFTQFLYAINNIPATISSSVETDSISQTVVDNKPKKEKYVDPAVRYVFIFIKEYFYVNQNIIFLFISFSNPRKKEL